MDTLLQPIITLTILNFLIIVRFHKIAMKREVLKTGAKHKRGPGCIAGRDLGKNI